MPKTKRHPAARDLLIIAGALAAYLAIASSADAALLGLSGGSPDIAAAKIQVSYNASTKQFVATGSTTFLTNTGNPDVSLGNVFGTFQITATISENMGVVTASNGTLLIQGKNSTLFGDANIHTLLQGTLVTGSPLPGFGYQNPPGGPRFQFRFNQSNPTAEFASLFTPMLGVNIDASSINFNGSFANNFDNYLNGAIGWKSATADITPEVPEPTSLAIWSAVGLGVAVMRWRRSTTRANRRRGLECPRKCNVG
jgi:hypothetical protein